LGIQIQTRIEKIKEQTENKYIEEIQHLRAFIKERIMSQTTRSSREDISELKSKEQFVESSPEYLKRSRQLSRPESLKKGIELLRESLHEEDRQRESRLQQRLKMERARLCETIQEEIEQELKSARFNSQRKRILQGINDFSNNTSPSSSQNQIPVIDEQIVYNLKQEGESPLSAVKKNLEHNLSLSDKQIEDEFAIPVGKMLEQYKNVIVTQKEQDIATLQKQFEQFKTNVNVEIEKKEKEANQIINQKNSEKNQLLTQLEELHSEITKLNKSLKAAENANNTLRIELKSKYENLLEKNKEELNTELEEKENTLKSTLNSECLRTLNSKKEELNTQFLSKKESLIQEFEQIKKQLQSELQIRSVILIPCFPFLSLHLYSFLLYLLTFSHILFS
jgi:hypothetical protein